MITLNLTHEQAARLVLCLALAEQLVHLKGHPALAGDIHQQYLETVSLVSRSPDGAEVLEALQKIEARVGAAIAVGGN